MTDFAKMTGQELCDWLSKQGIVYDDNCRLDEGIVFGIGNYNIPACAWAAERWCMNNCVGTNYTIELLHMIGNIPENLSFADKTCVVLFHANPELRLVAAARVVEDGEGGHG